MTKTIKKYYLTETIKYFIEKG